MERKIKHLVNRINLVYYGVYLLTIIAVATVFIMTFGNVETAHINETSLLGRNISTAYLIYLLVSIPFSLYGFTLRAKKWQNLEEDLMFEKYRKGASIRIIIIGLALVVGVVLVYIMKSKSMIFSSAIAAISLYFAKPTDRKIIRELNIK